eukprot:1881058-Lingulodinium_polyedra.AAC.1
MWKGSSSTNVWRGHLEEGNPIARGRHAGGGVAGVTAPWPWALPPDVGPRPWGVSGQGCRWALARCTGQ